MSLAFHLPLLPASPTESRRQGRAAAVIRHAAFAALAGAKHVGRAALVLGVFVAMLATAMALGLLIWVPHFHVNW
jgi:hypothetical protein